MQFDSNYTPKFKPQLVTVKFVMYQLLVKAYIVWCTQTNNL